MLKLILSCILSITSIIPKPNSVIMEKGSYKYENEPEVKIRMVRKGFGSPEAYSLVINKNGVVVKSQTKRGVFYAMQTLDQITEGNTLKEIPCCVVSDSPRFPYRGIHVDVSRHFRSVDFLKKQIDAMAKYKMNTMHLHLTDAAGWRLEIEAYPRLTSFAAWRPEALWKDWWTPGKRKYVEEGTPGAYGGYYTKEEIRDLIEYAHSKYVEIIPEIEMPGHSEEVVAAYPELGCTGEMYGVGEVCIGNEKTFEFFETVLDEVMDLFPSKYIHIGGDEASRDHWRNCPKCHERMQAEGLNSLDELQSYMIRRIDSYVSSKGRKIIGWDEILEGGLSPGATVMSWRGTEGGVEAMKQGHDVIMTPGGYCYLDFTQDAPFKEPESIGGYTPLSKVYSYEPVEESLSPAEISHLKGVQGNLWAEFIPTEAHAEYMYWPRAMAIAEIGWSKGEKDFEDFRARALKALQRMKEDGYNVFDLENEYGDRRASLNPVAHKAVGAKVRYNIPAHEKYQAQGDVTLTDGNFGGWTYGDNKWQGFLTDFDVTIDLGEVQDLHYIGATFMQSTGPYVYMPAKAEIYVSEDGVEYHRAAEIWNDVSESCPELLFKEFGSVCSEKARYIRYVAKKNDIVGAWLFVDEIVVN